jgi:hypothetical protein
VAKSKGRSLKMRENRDQQEKLIQILRDQLLKTKRRLKRVQDSNSLRDNSRQ